MLRTLSHSVLSLFYPQDCRICGGEVRSPMDGVACSDCWDETRIFDGSETLCTKCGAFLFGSRASGDPRCGRCESHSYDRAFAIGIYEGALSASILDLKRSPYFPRRIKRLIALRAEQIPLRADTVIIPVPLSKRRRRERGFNQASIIARVVGKNFRLRMDEQSLIRSVDTPMHRAGMDNKARARTVKNAFEVSRPKLIAGLDILLIDDVMTSGETVTACAEVLKKNGASSVSVLTIARAV